MRKSCGADPCYQAWEPGFLDKNLLVMQIVGHGNNEKENDQGTSHGQDFLAAGRLAGTVKRRAGEFPREHEDAGNGENEPN